MPQIYSAGYRASKQPRPEPHLLSDIGDPAVGIMSIRHPQRQWTETMADSGWIGAIFTRTRPTRL